jgi:outer membrane biosynthesis protein TonB
MAVPRPVLLALMGVALCAAAFLATRGAQEPGGSVTAVPAPTPTPSASKPHRSAPKDGHAKPKANHSAPKAHTPRPQPKPEPKHQAGPEPKPVAPTKPATPAVALAAVEAGAQAVTPPGAKPPAPPAPKPQPSLAARVKSALARGDAVVFLFTRAGAADDTGTRQSVETLRGTKRVMVVEAGLKDLSDFRPVLAGAGVSQIPSVVIVHKGGPARLIEGYVDPGTLRQNVADALR